MILIGQATVSAITNRVYKGGNLARFNFILTPLDLGARPTSKASSILILIVTVGSRVIMAQV